MMKKHTGDYTGLKLKMNDKYDNCPICGSWLTAEEHREYFSGAFGCGIRTVCHCDNCGSEWSLTYTLDFAYIYKDGMANG